MTELKRLDPNERVFVANGNKYYISSELSVARFHEFQILEIEAKINLNIQTLGQKLAEIWGLWNKMRDADAKVAFYKLMEGVEQIGHREHVLFRICALFINREDEDLGKITEDMISQKIEDWGDYAKDDFFARALNSTSGFYKDYNAMLRIISGQTESEKSGEE